MANLRDPGAGRKAKSRTWSEQLLWLPVIWRIKLGAGGLVRATGAAKKAVDRAGIVEKGCTGSSLCRLPTSLWCSETGVGAGWGRDSESLMVSREHQLPVAGECGNTQAGGITAGTAERKGRILLIKDGLC
ncbi:MAG: hypothetical protein RJR35_05840 [Thermoanaerobacterales bacterium]|nr:hypothetical protein [Thermoanaerobacterales bacterium]